VDLFCAIFECFYWLQSYSIWVKLKLCKTLNNSGKETNLWAILENIFYPPDNPQIYFCIMHFSSFDKKEKPL